MRQWRESAISFWHYGHQMTFVGFWLSAARWERDHCWIRLCRLNWAEQGLWQVIRKGKWTEWNRRLLRPFPWQSEGYADVGLGAEAPCWTTAGCRLECCGKRSQQANSCSISIHTAMQSPHHPRSLGQTEPAPLPPLWVYYRVLIVKTCSLSTKSHSRLHLLVGSGLEKH